MIRMRARFRRGLPDHLGTERGLTSGSGFIEGVGGVDRVASRWVGVAETDAEAIKKVIDGAIDGLSFTYRLLDVEATFREKRCAKSVQNPRKRCAKGVQNLRKKRQMRACFCAIFRCLGG